MRVVGVIQLVTGNLAMAESAQLRAARRTPRSTRACTGLAGFFLLLRAFSSGCAALTGVEAISNGVPAFKKPKATTPRRRWRCSAASSITMIMSIMVLRRATGVMFADDPPTQLLRERRSRSGHDLRRRTPVISQLATAVFAGFARGWRSSSRSSPG